MQTKNRKINKEELELWKLVTKNDKVLGKYTNAVEEKKSPEARPLTSKVLKVDKKSEEKKNNYFTQNIQINKRMQIKLQRGMIRPEAKLDLHGKALHEAKKSLSDFIKTCIQSNIRCILVITGKKKTLSGSKGLIRKNLPLWLKEHEFLNYILFHCYAIKKDGDDGARYVLLRKKDKVYNG